MSQQKSGTFYVVEGERGDSVLAMYPAGIPVNNSLYVFVDDKTRAYAFPSELAATHALLRWSHENRFEVPEYSIRLHEVSVSEITELIYCYPRIIPRDL